MDLAAIDLNLFLVLDAVLTEGSATAAARRLHVTQSAVSNALARLREVVGDPLVVRRGRGLVPTPVALQLAPRVAAGLHELRAALARDRAFDPATTTRRFTIALTDNQEVSDLPRIVARFEQRLPAAALQVVTVERLVTSDGLAAGLVDVALAPAAVTGPGLHQAPLYTEEGVLVVRRDNRTVGRRLDRAAFEATPYVDVQILGEAGHGHRVARDALARAGLRRRVVLTVPHFMAAAVAVSRTDWITGLPRRFAAEVSRHLPLRTVAGPLPSVGFDIALQWHDRTDADPGAKYLRALILAAIGDAGARRKNS
ncbi:LysR family transcriptional regulator [Nannocystis pusilla]|uniref:LysR family transcriptional regulator n=1 Tax=Nannocystis pusilla TaxID=889268 RepID=A0ABS7TTL0_9BACT|nr:LysR family transcriptional regulator [Nannocystis pusilla]